MNIGYKVGELIFDAKLRIKSEIRKNGVKVLGYRRFGKEA